VSSLCPCPPPLAQAFCLLVALCSRLRLVADFARSRGATDETFNHFVPTNFSTGARALLAFAVAGIEGARPVLTSEPLVDIGVIAASGKGTAIVVVNWGSTPVQALNLTLQFKCDFSDATLASGHKLAVGTTDQGWISLVFDLGIADSVILRLGSTLGGD
jgi:hypothetical protein